MSLSKCKLIDSLCTHWKIRVDPITCERCGNGEVIVKRYLMEQALNVIRDRNIEKCIHFREVTRKRKKSCCGGDGEVEITLVFCKKTGHDHHRAECYQCSNFEEKK